VGRCWPAPLHHCTTTSQWFLQLQGATREPLEAGRQLCARHKLLSAHFPPLSALFLHFALLFSVLYFILAHFFRFFFCSYGADCYNFCVCAAFKLKRRTFLAIFLPFLRIFSGTLRVERKEDIFMGCVWGFLENDFLTYFKK